LNPENIRGMGNNEAADWLEAKHAEWDDALHQYETNGFAVKNEVNEALNMVLKLERVKCLQTRTALARQLNQKYGLDLPLLKQGSLPI
jgi:hypothetical protein